MKRLPSFASLFLSSSLCLAVTSVVLMSGALCASAAEVASVPTAEATVINSIWSSVMPVIVLLISTLGPLAGGYIVTQIISLLGITNQTKKLDVEKQLRDVLHFCAVNALKFAFTKAKLPLDAELSASVISDALFYIKDKNPDTVAALGLNDADLTHILQARASDVASTSSGSIVLGEAIALPGAALPAAAAA